MSQHKIEPHKITKPIQLLAAWLTGLAIVNISFLTAASHITTPYWIPGFLTIASVINVPVFLVGIFLLQTKFRPEMQEDSYYSDYLNRKNGEDKVILTKAPDNKLELKIVELSNKISDLVQSNPTNFNEQVRELISDEKIDELANIAGNSRTLSELYLKPERWAEIVKKWRHDKAFKDDIEKLSKHQLIERQNNNKIAAMLTELGKKVAKKAEDEKILFAQTNSEYFETDSV